MKSRFYILTLAFALLTTQALAQDIEYKLSYNVYAGGLKALKATYAIQNTPSTYQIDITAETQGVIGKVFPWSATYKTTGINSASGFIPEQHASTSTWKDNEKIKDIQFTNGEVSKYSVTKEGKTHIAQNLKDDLISDAHDLLTAIASTFRSISLEEGCASSAIAFDGKRKFKVTLNDGEEKTLSSSKYSSFSGQSVKCTLTVDPIAGFREKDQKRGWMAVQNHTQDRGKLPAIWFGQLEENGPYVPVRMQIASDYGAVIAHLTDISIPSLNLLEAASGQ